MRRSFTSRASSIVFTAAALVACGGGGDAPPPLPPPRVAPAVLPPAPFGLTSSQSFAVLGWTLAPGASAWSEIAADTATFSWSATLASYELELKDVGSGSLIYAVPGNNPLMFTLRFEDGSKAPLDITVFDKMQTAGWLWWSPQQGHSLSTGIAAFGIATAASDIPASGTRKFLGNDSPGYIPLDLDFDFGAGQLTGKLRIAWDDAWGPYPAATYDLSPATFDRTANRFSATFTLSGAPDQGSLHGMFMGPGAREVAVAWQGPTMNPSTGEWETNHGTSLGYCTNCGN